ncbi:l-asparaginase ii [Neofusicoccum parvum]|uniref:L-asparaginase ii n=1 Tax=Neofusicoccum parvum TaxID=310453 RepID=A0ACB5SFC7_9PEZI|nr:l-asparaginase ii [Neofusicoccum parvum]
MTRTTVPDDFVVTDRGGVVENRHAVHAAVVDSTGALLFTAGDAARLTLARSAAKPAQALAIIEAGGLGDAFGFDDADLALMCASHSSEDRHVARARAMLAKARAAEHDLRCGGHPAISDAVNRAWIKRDFAPTAVCNNCSGKHAGMLAGARALGAPKEGYHLPDHPIQLRVRGVVEDLCGLGADDVKWGIDGCNLPAPAIPLRHLARMYASFAEAADAVESDAGAPARTQAQARIFNAMARYPELVGGEGRFCTVLMEAFGGALIGKVGADGCYGIGVRASEQTRRLGAKGAVGISVKIEDGSLEILYAVAAEILQQLGIGTPDLWERLAAFHQLKRLNTAGVVTGRVSYPFKVRAT